MLECITRCAATPTGRMPSVASSTTDGRNGVVGGRLLVVVALEHRSRINAGPRAVAKEKLAKIVQVVGGIY